MGNYKDIEDDDMLQIFGLPSGGTRREKERRIKKFLADNRGKYLRLCTCREHKCSAPTPDNEPTSPPPPGIPKKPSTISTHPTEDDSFAGSTASGRPSTSGTTTSAPISPPHRSTTYEPPSAVSTSPISHTRPSSAVGSTTATSVHPSISTTSSAQPSPHEESPSSESISSSASSRAISKYVKAPLNKAFHPLKRKSGEDLRSSHGAQPSTTRRPIVEILGPYYDPIPEEKEENDTPKDIQKRASFGLGKHLSTGGKLDLEDLFRRLSEELGDEEERLADGEGGDFEVGEGQSSRGKGKESMIFPADELEDEEEDYSMFDNKGMNHEEYEDFISDLLQPKLSVPSGKVVTFSKEEIEEFNRRAKAMTELYKSNLAKGISSDETYEMLERGEIIIDM